MNLLAQITQIIDFTHPLLEAVPHVIEPHPPAVHWYLGLVLPAQPILVEAPLLTECLAERLHHHAVMETAAQAVSLSCLLCAAGAGPAVRLLSVTCN